MVTELVGRRQGGKAVWNLDFALYGEAGEDVDKQYRRQLGLVEDLVERGLRLAYNKYGIRSVALIGVDLADGRDVDTCFWTPSRGG